MNYDTLNLKERRVVGSVIALTPAAIVRETSFFFIPHFAGLQKEALALRRQTGVLTIFAISSPQCGYIDMSLPTF